MARPVPVIADASPLIVLARSGALHLLRDLFGVVVITATVRDEVLPPKDLPGKHAIERAIGDGSILVDEQRPPILARLREHVDDGEASTIEAGVVNPGALVVIDDLTARALAIEPGLKVTGTLGILLGAKEAGLVSRISDILASMLDHGFYASRELIATALERAGESSPSQRSDRPS